MAEHLNEDVHDDDRQVDRHPALVGSKHPAHGVQNRVGETFQKRTTGLRGSMKGTLRDIDRAN